MPFINCWYLLTFQENAELQLKSYTMTILYLHGLESELSAAKKVVLEQYGRVIAPDLDYHHNPEAVLQKSGGFNSYSCKQDF